MDAAHESLGWPPLEKVLAPTGAGPAVLAELARRKLGNGIRHLPFGASVQIGVLVSDEADSETEELIAVVCDFPGPIPHETLRALQRLAWNFCQSKLLVTVEPHQIRTWSCWERPQQITKPTRGTLDLGPLGQDQRPLSELPFDQDDARFTTRAANLLHWVRLVTGDYFERHKKAFQRDQRADRQLLANLRFVRTALKSSGLPDDVVHDLLARLIFIQFLWQRTDASGVAALNEGTLEQLHREGVISRRAKGLNEILPSKDDTYALFRWLNDRFNGDLFPGKGSTPEEREAEWQAELEVVEVAHLELLAAFVSGDLRLADGQLSLWPLYSFDAIPLEFISSIYEVFVRDTGGAARAAHYTPRHLVDFVLDGVLPWNATRWDIRVVDPSCGSGIFLVKVFQRMIHAWRRAHPGEEPDAQVLRDILETRIFGVDIDEHAVRVASFSLYLALCDELEPKHVWESLEFPQLRGRTLIHADFFSEDVPAISCSNGAGSFDLIVGNPPWGRNQISQTASKWAAARDLAMPYKEVGTLFLFKAAELVSASGSISLVQPAMALLFNHHPKALAFRRELFRRFTVHEIVNLAPWRFLLFPYGLGPACIITLQAVKPPVGHIVRYVCPKPTGTDADYYQFKITYYDNADITCDEASEDPWVWTALAWGGRRDLQFLHQLAASGVRGTDLTLASFRDREGWKGREGYKRGDCLLAMPKLADGTHFHVNSENIQPFRLEGPLIPNSDPLFDKRKGRQDPLIFTAPLLLVAKVWHVEEGFRASLTDVNALYPASSVFGFHYPEAEARLAEALCILLNSSLASYFFSLTSGQLAAFVPQVLTTELLALPVGSPDTVEAALGRRTLDSIVASSEVDDVAQRWLRVSPADAVLIEDFTSVVLRDFRQPQLGIGRSRPTKSQLGAYCDWFMKVLKAGFGEDKAIQATVYVERAHPRLPMRMIVFRLNAADPGLKYVTIQDEQLFEELRKIAETEQKREGVSVVHERVIRFYGSADDGSLEVVLIKPDQYRYWTRSIALRDADVVGSDILLHAAAASAQPEVAHA